VPGLACAGGPGPGLWARLVDRRYTKYHGSLVGERAYVDGRVHGWTTTLWIRTVMAWPTGWTSTCVTYGYLRCAAWRGPEADNGIDVVTASEFPGAKEDYRELLTLLARSTSAAGPTTTVTSSARCSRRPTTRSPSWPMTCRTSSTQSARDGAAQ
jgi:hypothetical protein